MSVDETYWSVWGVAGELNQGDGVEVKYDSRRGDGIFTMKGRVTEVVARDYWCKIKFVRDDGQECSVDTRGELRSIGSDYPVTGDVEGVRVIEDY